MIFRGAIYDIASLPGVRGREQHGARLAVIVQSDQFATSTVTVAMTSTRAGAAIYRPEVTIDGVDTRILTDQVFSIDPGRLRTFRGSLSAAELRDFDRALMLKFGLL